MLDPSPPVRITAQAVGLDAAVDTTRGPAAFCTLGALRKGDHITVHRRDKSIARFTVTALNVYERDNFPSTSVYAPTAHPLLTLITCADWDPGNRTYTANLVVTAQPEPQQVSQSARDRPT
ncbi:sortase domain-containing protein [Streptomyces parvus]|uniref:sortase domain-containing protein n=1 Tax=Streptomyces parvus TaxID=66428 RepID=UPI0037116C50